MKEILSTLGPASFDPRIITRLAEIGVSLFRLNLSHTRIADLEATIDLVLDATNVPLCLDTEGAQVRTGEFSFGPVELDENAILRIPKKRVPGNQSEFNLYPRHVVNELLIGDFLSIDFNSVLAQVVAKDDEQVEVRILNAGKVGGNKAVTIERDIPLAPLTEKDIAAIEIGRRKGVRHFALSFAGSGQDVATIRDLAGPDAFIISKVESRKGLTNLDHIVASSDAILIDRGDLSREIPIEIIPQTQKTIIQRAKAQGQKVYVATNLLESMINEPGPTRAEVNDIFNTLQDGADGLVLAAETAIGKQPIQCATMIAKMMHSVEHSLNFDQIGSREIVSLLTEPLGGELVNRMTVESTDVPLDEMPSVTLSQADLMDADQIAHGTFSPLTGFMDSQTLNSVLDHYRLPDGTPWPLPILLALDDGEARSVAVGERVALRGENGDAYGYMDVTEIFETDLDSLAERWFLTSSDAHPGVQRVRARGNRYVAGEINLVRRPASRYQHYQLSPEHTRFVFAHKGWSKVVGFHTRNAPHRAHEYLQMTALELSNADGLYISPVIGPKKKGDLLPEPLMRSHQVLLDFGIYPRGRVVLGSFATYPRYAGPREAVFTALCRRNMGCSHFIIGRDHTGVGNFYPPDANRELFEHLGDIGIQPVFFDTIGYDETKRAYGPVAAGQAPLNITGTTARHKLKAGEPLPDWYMRDIVQDVLRSYIDAGAPIFTE